jgi:phosphoribosyl-AMP cyclohydrolase
LKSKDETVTPALTFGADGLMPTIVQDVRDNAILMFAHMNAEALAATRATGLVHFWSRSRAALWLKGETSGESFKVEQILVDCDQDCLLVRVSAIKTGTACHTGRRSCFYRALEGEQLAFVN